MSTSCAGPNALIPVLAILAMLQSERAGFSRVAAERCASFVNRRDRARFRSISVTPTGAFADRFTPFDGVEARLFPLLFLAYPV